MASQRIGRTGLYALVWSELLSQFANRFNISDAMLEKIFISRD